MPFTRTGRSAKPPQRDCYVAQDESGIILSACRRAIGTSDRGCSGAVGILGPLTRRRTHAYPASVPSPLNQLCIMPATTTQQSAKPMHTEMREFAMSREPAVYPCGGRWQPRVARGPAGGRIPGQAFAAQRAPQRCVRLRRPLGSIHTVHRCPGFRAECCQQAADGVFAALLWGPPRYTRALSHPRCTACALLSRTQAVIQVSCRRPGAAQPRGRSWAAVDARRIRSRRGSAHGHRRDLPVRRGAMSRSSTRVSSSISTRAPPPRLCSRHGGNGTGACTRCGEGRPPVAPL
jgi:hypothetical protein